MRDPNEQRDFYLSQFLLPFATYTCISIIFKKKWTSKNKD